MNAKFHFISDIMVVLVFMILNISCAILYNAGLFEPSLSLKESVFIQAMFPLAVLVDSIIFIRKGEIKFTFVCVMACINIGFLIGFSLYKYGIYGITIH